MTKGDSSVDSPAQRPASFAYSPMFPLGAETTPWRKLPIEGVRTLAVDGKTVLRIAPELRTTVSWRSIC